MIENINVTTGQYVKLSYEVADIEQRILAIVMDRILQYIILLCGIFVSSSFVNPYYFIVLVYIFISCMNVFIEYLSHGQTIGKMLMRITVVSDDGVPPSFSQCVIRWLLYPIDFWVVGVVLINKKSQRIGDIASGCYVVKKQTNKMVKVSLEDDYKYTDPKYKPRFENVLLLTSKDMGYVKSALYDKKFYSQQDQVARLIRKRMGIQNSDMSDKQFLQQVRNDYYYQVQVLEKEPAV
ncbi:MAG: RDD family protein [Paludibacteraceae bacterium]|nr:RDD family protein [Prevotellaceae bacterium]